MGVLTKAEAKPKKEEPGSFNPLHRGMGVLTKSRIKLINKLLPSFNPLHRGMGVLTFDSLASRFLPGEFQSSTSRHGGTDFHTRGGVK